ncbi:MAG TPA: RNA polymerase sigma-70 factor [Arachidicoccus sp.]|nr:RNA polymerase sigma-70 factor [Arachidicoccus sp.]
MNFNDPNTDEYLLSLLKNDSVDAFTKLYERYWDRMLYMAISKLKNTTEAEEVVQDVFANLWKRRRELDVHGSFSAYLAVAVKYKILNLLTKERRARDYSHYKNHTEAGYSTCTEDLVTFEDLQHRLSVRINALPEKGRLAFKLSREEGLSHKEIAWEMQISEKAVERNIARSVRALYMSMRHLLTSN